MRTSEILGRGASAAGLLQTVPARWRWHYRVLVSLQNRLLRDNVELRGEAAEPLEPHSLDEADSASDEFEHDLALAQLSAEQDALFEINEALKRILNGSYGICQETGRVISAARLKAIPWARFTRDVEERLEKKGVVSRTRVPQAHTVRERGRVWLAPEEEAEETEEQAPAPPKDEALARVFSPPGRHVSRERPSQRSPRAARRKGKNA